jgi:acetyl-CoA synthetase
MNFEFNKFWLEQAKIINWNKKPKTSFVKKKDHHPEWYSDGKVNIYENCILKHINNGLSNKIALTTCNLKKEIKKYTYGEIDFLVNNFCSFISKYFKNEKIYNKRIMIHSSASIFSAVSMLGCAKLGIHFSVIFEDLELNAIKKRIKLFKPDIFISRWSKENFFKKFSFKKNKTEIFFSRDINIFKKRKKMGKIQYFKSTKSLFTLFTSGSTGSPKGIIHSSGGYLVYSKYTCIKQFGMNSNSVVLTASDAGWINGHTYALFGPLSLGASSILLESPMLLLDFSFLKKIIKYKISILYLPVTLIRLLKAINRDKNIKSKSLITLGSMGEPLAPAIGKWFANFFNLNKKSIINTYFQTETCGIISSPKFTDKIKEVPHGSVGSPVSKFLNLTSLTKKKKQEIKIINSWPGCMKNIINGKIEWKKYWSKEGYFRMFDLATIEKSNIYIHGRIDDVINIRGHRIGSEEIESIILEIKDIFECSVILINDDLEGSVIHLFIVSKKQNLDKKIEDKIYSNFGSFALPKKIYYLSQLPKTRSGKILRRLLREMVNSPESSIYGDTSTMINPGIINEIKRKILND